MAFASSPDEFFKKNFWEIGSSGIRFIGKDFPWAHPSKHRFHQIDPVVEKAVEIPMAVYPEIRTLWEQNLKPVPIFEDWVLSLKSSSCSFGRLHAKLVSGGWNLCWEAHDPDQEHLPDRVVTGKPEIGLWQKFHGLLVGGISTNVFIETKWETTPKVWRTEELFGRSVWKR